DKERASDLTIRLYNEAKRMHHLHLYWITSLMSYIGRHLGDEALEEAQKEFISVAMADGAKRRPQKRLEGTERLRQAVQNYAERFRATFSPVTIDEDEEKFVLEMRPCGSGGHLIIEDSYENFGFLKIKRPQPMTYGQSDFPVYCTHGACAAMVQMESGTLDVFEDPSEELGKKPCKFYIYKDPKSIPSEFYTKVGKKKDMT
ncbi:MAG: hypothetical protein PHV74_15890, partial [Dehalococcoidia bacterium]|nr:hypothetical protein [Dehalococcoidia bacterium]